MTIGNKEAEANGAASGQRRAQPVDSTAFGVIVAPLSEWERIGNIGALRTVRRRGMQS